MKVDGNFLRSALSAEQRDLLTQLLREEGIQSLDADTIPRRLTNDALPLSSQQQRLWLLEQLTPGTSVHNVPLTLRLSGVLNVAALERALNEIIRRHEALRTSFSTLESHAIQVITANIALELTVDDLSELPEPDRETRALELACEELEQPLNLRRAPLIRARLVKLATTEHVLLITMHHIISDGWSLNVLISELGSLYNSFCDDKPSTLRELPIQYADFAIWERHNLAAEELAEQLSYWKQKLAGAPQALALPTDHPHPAVHSYYGADQFLELSETLANSLRRLSRQEDCSSFMILLAAFNVLIHRYSSQTDILIGTPLANRLKPQVENLIGFFINTLVLRTDVSGTPTFREVMRRVRAVCLEGYAHQAVPFERVVEEVAKERTLNRTPLFQVMFSLQHTVSGHLNLKGLETGQFYVPLTRTKFDLTLTFFEKRETLRGVFQYNTDLFEADTIQRMVENFEVLLRGIVADPDKRIDLLPLLSTHERERLLVEWNDTRRQYSREDLVHRMFEEQAERTPDAVALVFENQQLSYRQLNERANQLAHYLREIGVRPERLVGICLEKSIDMFVAVLGILKAGGAYLPIDPASPLQRIAFMVEDAELGVVISEQSIANELRSNTVRVICLDKDAVVIDQQSFENLPGGASSDNASYVIYTSGSTGKPKGVVIEHRQLSNYLHAIIERVGLAAGASFAMVQPLTVDSCQTVIFPALCTGGCLHLISRERSVDPHWLSEYFRRHKIECLKIAPSHLAALQVSLRDQDGIMPSRWLVLGGESSRRQWVEELQRLAPECTIFNHYGPTEATVGVLTYQNKPDGLHSGAPLVPMGRPLGNTRAYILDSNLQPVPIGVTGELFLGGDCLARGYLHHPELTAERFIADPFSIEPGARLYRTGDLARYLADGDIEFLGRLDHQVKVRGFRIELSEIKQKLDEHDAVRESVVMLREDEGGREQLVAYVVLKPETKPAIVGLRLHLKDALPEYMIPTAFVLLDELPRSPHGKLDRLALAKPFAQTEVSKEYVAPRTPTESAMVQIWQEVLKIEHLGIHDNFFEIGGHSLLAMQILARIREVFEVELPLRKIFEKPTVEGLSLIVAQCHEKPGGKPIQRITPRRQSPEELLSMIDLLSEEETEALLKEHSSLKEENFR